MDDHTQNALDEFAHLDATAQAELVRSGEVQAIELVDAAIARIERLNPKVNAVVHKSYESARVLAKSSRLPHGHFRGVPYLIKDLAEQKGEPWGLGSRLLTNYKARYDHGSVERAKEAGLIILGRTNTPELGLMPTTEGARFGASKNPWSLSHHTGGSSGGAAAAVATGMVPFAHASDGGGSIRIPASICGLFGLKPSRHRLYKNTKGRDIVGDIAVRFCLSRSVRDSARLLSIAEDKTAKRFSPTGFVSGPSQKRLRIAYTTDTHYRGGRADDDVKEAIESTAKLCATLGHEVEQGPPPPFDTEEFAHHFFVVWTSVSVELVERAFELGLLQRRFRRAKTHLERWTRELAARFRETEKKNPNQVEEALVYFKKLEMHFRDIHEKHDVVLSPVLRTPPLRLGEMSHETPIDELFAQMTDYAPYTSPHNAAGVPAMSVPLSFSKSGLPIGSQFSAGPGCEKTLLHLAYELEEAAPWSSKWPGVSALG